MKKIFSVVFATLLFFPVYLSSQTNNKPTNNNTTTTTNNNSTDNKKKDPKLKTFGGKVYNAARVYIEPLDLIKFNARYYGRVVYLYAYFVERPHELKLVFQDYKKTYVMVHMSRSHLYNLANLYKDKLYEIRARVGKVRDGWLHVHFVELYPTFLEKTMNDQFIQ